MKRIIIVFLRKVTVKQFGEINVEGSETRDLIFEIYIESTNGKLIYFLFKILSLKWGETKRLNF